MATLGNGPYPTSAVADNLGKQHQELSTIRSRLINKGMIWSPSYGTIDFTVPFFGAFLLRRIAPR
jgi:hypothetical protein